MLLHENPTLFSKKLIDRNLKLNYILIEKSLLCQNVIYFLFSVEQLLRNLTSKFGADFHLKLKLNG